MSPSRKIRALVALAGIGAAAVAWARPVGTVSLVAAGPGNQTDPSIDGQFVVYADDAGGDLDVVQADILTGGRFVIAGGPGDQDRPDVARSVVTFRGPEGIWVVDYLFPIFYRRGGDPGIDVFPVTSVEVAAWEVGTGETDVRAFTFGLGELRDRVFELPGRQHSPSADLNWVAFADDAGAGRVLLFESRDELLTEWIAVRADSLGVAALQSGPHAAVARVVTASDTDVEVYGPDGARLAALTVPARQVNPHLSGSWVAFEDLSTGRSQVVLWNWRTGLVFVPRPSEGDQILNDVSDVGTAVRVVFADDAAGDFDVVLFALPIPIVDDGTPLDPWPPPPPPPPPPPGKASCEAADAVVLAKLELERDTSAPQSGSVAFDVARDVPVLVCIDADRVSAAWVTLDHVAVATPSDFEPKVDHLEVRTALDEGRAVLAGRIAGKPGARLTVRVLADPGREDDDGDCDDDDRDDDDRDDDDRDDDDRDDDDRDDDDRDDDERDASALRAGASSGCGTAGGAGLLALGALLALGLRRRSR